MREKCADSHNEGRDVLAVADASAKSLAFVREDCLAHVVECEWAHCETLN